MRKITLLGWALCVLLLCAARLWDRSSSLALKDRPILLVLGLYIAAFVVMLAALRVMVKSSNSQRLIPTVIVFGLSFRLIHLFSAPFLEIDAYRYMWDGIVTSHGISPYKWSPAQAREGSDAIPVEERAIVDLANSTPSVNQIVSKVHYGQFTTIYPPVSQAVFAVTMGLVPNSASVTTHLRAMKVALICFDVGTLFLILGCLRVTGRSFAWVIAYAWNPLLIKEIANSGHLDSIAVFFLSAAVYLLLKEFKREGVFRIRSGVLAALLLSLGIGSKLFPVVLVPLFVVWIWQRNRKASLAFAGTAVLATGVVLSPMLIEVANGQRGGSSNGLTGFLSRWRMNALLFDVVYENAQSREGKFQPWYSIASDSTRASLQAIADRVPGSLPAPTKVARFTTLGIFAVIYLLVLCRVLRRSEHLTDLPKDAFWLLAAFLFLQPTLNPWYWVWLLPFACFLGNVGWHMVGASLLLYYARFWFKYSGVVMNLGGTEYVGVHGFDHILVWVEHALFVVGVVAFRFFDRRTRGSSVGDRPFT